MLAAMLASAALASSLSTSALVPDEVAKITLDDVGSPGADVRLYASFEGRGEGPCSALGVCLDLVDPELFRTATVNNDGDATFEFFVPARYVERTITFQAVVVDGKDVWVSGVWERTVCDDEDGDGVCSWEDCDDGDPQVADCEV